MNAERRCRNCQAALLGRFCSACGQPDADPNPRLADLTDDFVGEILHWDGKVPSTLKALILKPGVLTADFFAGKRVRWLSPFRLYLLISIVYFLTPPLIERLTGFSGRAMARLEITGDSATEADLAILGDSVAFVNAPEIRGNAVIALIGPEKAWTLIQNPVVMKETVAEAIPRAMFVLMPFFALLTWLVWRSGGLNYPAHMVFAFHVHSAFFAVMWVARLIEPIGSLALNITAQVVLLLYSTWYVVRACRVALGGTAREVLGRTTIVGLLYFPVALAIMFAAVAIAINAL